MKKDQKSQIEDCINSLFQAHEEIKTALRQRNYGTVKSMLGECQEFAVSIGESIERLEGKEHATVRCLEEYCELLFHVYEELDHGAIDEIKIQKRLKKQAIKLENSVKNNIKTQKEIVFLPYKASMWDSLESIYFAAAENKDCVAYVIPIPYYDRNPDGSFGEMHYEGFDFPENIIITSWQKYSIKERRPDVIYIHNPYDNFNIVTSVHPDFYARELKKHTEKLVYVPYFLLGEVDPDDQAAVNGIKHFVWLPGVVIADKVIVQSEKMKKIYVNEYLKAAKASGMSGMHLDRKYLEQKILGLGSPKLDKVQRLKKGSQEVPRKWLKIIEKADGGRKKIIFYNTGLSSLLQNNEKWLEAIEGSLNVFKEERENVALLWRPHPLLETTLKSMRPWLVPRYLEIKKRFIEEGWGIYDESTDMDRAVVLSDAYYGDGSSVVQVYQQTGNPIMYQNVDAEYVRKPFFIDAVWDGNDIIYPAINDNALYKTSLITGKTAVIELIEEKKKNNLYVGICKWHEYFILSSRNSRPALAFYNLHKREWKYIDVEKEKHGWLDFREEDVFEFDNYIYIFSAKLVVIRVDLCMDKMEFLYYPDANAGDELRGNILRVGDLVYIPLRHSNKIYRFDLKTEQTDILEVSTELKGIYTLCFDGSLFWLAGLGRMIYSWDEKTGECIKYEAFPRGFEMIFTKKADENDAPCFSKSFLYQQSIYFVPCFANMLVKLDLSDRKLTEVKLQNEEETEATVMRSGRLTAAKYGAVKQNNDRLMLLSAKNKNIILVNLNSEGVEKVELDISQDKHREVVPDENNIINEIYVDLKRFIEYVKQRQNTQQNDTGDMVGEEIFRMTY